MGWRILGESRRFDSDDDEIREAYEEGCRKGYKKAMKEIHEGGEYGERDDWDDDDDDEIIYTEHETELVVGSTEEVLDAGFTFDEDSPEGIFDDVFSSESADDDEE